MDTAEHMFTKCSQLKCGLTASTAESVADLLYEMGKGLSDKRNYELAVRWLERAHDVLEEQKLEMLSVEAGELRLSIMLSLGFVCLVDQREVYANSKIAHDYMELKGPEARNKAWNMVKLLDAASICM